MKVHKIDRRRFLKLSASLTAMLATPTVFAASSEDKWGKVLPRRKLGNTGMDLTMFAVGGQPARVNLEVYPEILETALEQGCRFFETARAYSNGKSEKIYGEKLKPYRKEIALMSKTYANDEKSLWMDLDASLKALQTDYIDIYLMHAVSSEENIDRRLKGGVYDAMLKAKEQGIIGHIGFSGHSNNHSHNYFIEKRLPGLEVVLLPVNVADPLYESFIINTIPKAVENNMGIIAMKSFADGAMFGQPISWGHNRGQEREPVVPGRMSLEEVQHFCLSLPVTTATVGFHDPKEVKEVAANVRSFAGMSETMRNDLTSRIMDLAEKYTLEPYKDH